MSSSTLLLRVFGPVYVRQHLGVHLQVSGKRDLHHSWVMERYGAAATGTGSTWWHLNGQVMEAVFCFQYFPALRRYNWSTKGAHN